MVLAIDFHVPIRAISSLGRLDCWCRPVIEPICGTWFHGKRKQRPDCVSVSPPLLLGMPSSKSSSRMRWSAPLFLIGFRASWLNDILGPVEGFHLSAFVQFKDEVQSVGCPSDLLGEEPLVITCHTWWCQNCQMPKRTIMFNHPWTQLKQIVFRKVWAKRTLINYVTFANSLQDSINVAMLISRS